MKKVAVTKCRKSNSEEKRKTNCKDRDKQTQILGNIQQIDAILFEGNGRTRIARWQRMSKVSVLSHNESFLSKEISSGVC